ncbi:MAG: tetratricopeptide repeat protein [Candidatus Cryptobacteroides sp.]|jgi:tetratricopeptide (TPR) repeat protein|nr:tetratricopeptide repeat protein [Rikenellaceae bacterium]
MKKLLSIIFMVFVAATLPLFAQTDRREVRAGNRKFSKGNYAESEIDYRKAVLKDSLSIAGQYNLASALYRQENFEEAANSLAKIDAEVAETPYASDYYYNEGDVALQRKDYAAAVKAFRESLLLNPGDLDAKENYLYAKEMLKNQQGGGQGQNQDQNQQQDQDKQNQDNKQDNNQQDQPQNQDKQEQQPQDRQGDISQQQARQMLHAVQAQEKETQEKVKKEKAALLKSSQKEKNW